MTKKLYAKKTLRMERKKRGYTAIEFADLLSVILQRNVSESTLQKWEAGSVPLPASEILEISRYFRIPLKDLVERKDERSKTT